ncbi:MAG: protein kinase [Acidobacteriaceae bacterium]
MEVLGRVFAGYRVDELLGKGGMGVVYRAVDLQLGRNVALKFVSEEFGEGGDNRSRLLREAKAAASLNHPNICTIYAAGEAEGQLFIAMEYLEGSDLRHLVRQGALPWEQAVSICKQVGRGLEEAHSKNIFHRDVKSANIFVTRNGAIKLLDFGIASCVVDPDVTRTAGFVGTPSYMAPEQLDFGAGDFKSDIWSLGVVLYEMLTGTLPFGGDGKPALWAIVTEAPTPIASMLPEAPPELDKIISRALEKDPKDRYATITEMIADLDRVGRDRGARITQTFTHFGKARVRTPVRVELRTIAVMPFVNVSSDPADDCICDGMAEELINGLIKLEGVRVISSSTSFQCRGTSLDPREIGSKLGASHLVNCSLRHSGNQVRLTAQLTNTKDGYLLWSQRFDATMKDLFSLQDELSISILEPLRGKLTVADATRRVKPATGNAAAYESYLRGRHLFNQHTGEGLGEALECLVRASELDPAQSRYHVAVAECHALQEWYGIEATGDAIPRVKAALETGLELEPDSFNALCLLATVQAGYDWDWSTAEHTFRHALAAGRGSGSVWFHYALDLLTPLGRMEEALDACQTALGLDPLSAITCTALGGCYYRMRRWKDAEASLRTTLELHPGFGHAYWSLGRVLLELGETDRALQQFDEALRIMGPSPEALAELAYGLARTGQTDKARQILEELDSVSERQFVSPLNYALVHTGLGDRTAAIAQLERAFEQRARRLMWISADPRFEPLQEEPAFQQLLSRMGLGKS